MAYGSLGKARFHNVSNSEDRGLSVLILWFVVVCSMIFCLFKTSIMMLRHSSPKLSAYPVLSMDFLMYMKRQWNKREIEGIIWEQDD